MRIIFSLLLVCFLVQISHARDLEPIERQTLDLRLQQFETDLIGGNVKGVMDTIPPQFLKLVAKRSEIEISVLLDAMEKQLNETIKRVSFEGVEFDMQSPNIESGKTVEGNEVAYLIIPLSFVMTVSDISTKFKQPMLALYENKIWYFSRLEQAAQIQLIGEVYPFINDVDLPASISQIIKK